MVSSQALLIISFPYFKCFLVPVHLLIIHFSLFNCSGVLKISQRFVFPLCFSSRSFEDVLSFKPFNSTGAIYLPSDLFNGVSFEWALTHRSFPRMLPDSSNSPGAILKKFFSKFDVRMNCHQSYVFLQHLSNSGHRWFIISILHCSGVAHHLSWWFS